MTPAPAAAVKNTNTVTGNNYRGPLETAVFRGPLTDLLEVPYTKKGLSKS
jgi:hypothetical protein